MSKEILIVSMKALLFLAFIIDVENQFITPLIVVTEYVYTVFCTIITLR